MTFWRWVLKVFKAGQENLLLKNLQVKTRVENVRFLSWKIFLVGKYGIQSTNKMAFKRTVPLPEFSISRHQIWCAHAIVVQRMHACACKMPSCWWQRGKRGRETSSFFPSHHPCSRRARYAKTTGDESVKYWIIRFSVSWSSIRTWSKEHSSTKWQQNYGHGQALIFILI